MDYRLESPPVLREFLTYHETIKAHSKITINEYFLDLRNFFRFLKVHRNIVSSDSDFEEISILDISLAFVGDVTLEEVYAYLSYLSRDKIKNPNSNEPEYGISASARARKVATLRSFYKYLTVKTKQLSVNPIADLDSPKVPKTLPRYLSLDESINLLNSVDGKYKSRDYCLLCLLLNCGMRVSELVGLNIGDIKGDSLRLVGKGNKERIIYLNSACISAIEDYLPLRESLNKNKIAALFLSERNRRLSVDSVQVIVKNNLLRAGLDPSKYSPHKLRHTAATLMLQNGVDVRTLQEVLGHEHLNTTQIYTHVDNSELRIAANANPLANFSKENKEND